jgi:hypothetical protein
VDRQVGVLGCGWNRIILQKIREFARCSTLDACYPVWNTVVAPILCILEALAFYANINSNAYFDRF